MLPHGLLIPFILVTALFFLWGVPNNLNDILIRQFMKSFALSRFQAGLVQSAFYMGYFVLATPAALLMCRFGYKSGFIVGLLLFGAGAFLFWPAALLGKYQYFLAALFVIASGLSFLETASNPFVAQLGAPETAGTSTPSWLSGRTGARSAYQKQVIGTPAICTRKAPNNTSIIWSTMVILRSLDTRILLPSGRFLTGSPMSSFNDSRRRVLGRVNTN